MIYGYTVEGTYVDKTDFFFSLLPAVGVSRQDDFWSLQIIFMNLTLALFIGKGEIDDESDH